MGWADVLLALEELRVKTLQDVAEADAYLKLRVTWALRILFGTGSGGR